MGAGCGYPLNAKEPLKEASIFDGIAQQESIPYSSAKKMLIVQAYAYETQHDIQSTVFIPSNLYGKFDNFNLEKSHVVPALIHKFYSATKNNTKEVEIWGDGSAKRDFIYTDDVSRLMIKAAIEFNGTNVINLASGKQTSIKDLAEILIDISGFKGTIAWNDKMPTGQKSRSFSIEKLNKSLSGIDPFMPLSAGLQETYSWFEKNYHDLNVRL